LPDIPDHDALEKDDDVWGWFAKAAPEMAVNPHEAFGGENKKILESFIAHCREESGLWIY